MKRLSKTKKRTDIINSIIKSLTDEEIFNTLDYKRNTESAIKQFMYQPLLIKVQKMLEENGVDKNKSKIKAKESIIWESNKQTTLHNMMLFGTQHRPDIELKYDGLRIAIEVKKGSNGSDIRQGFGQCLVYGVKYDFVIFVMVDTSNDKRILNSSNAKKESYLTDSLWDNYNAKFVIV